MKRKHFIFGIFALLMFHITGCKKHSSGPTPIPSIYRSDDSTTGIFNYTGIVYDSAWVIDSIFPPLQVSPSYPSGFHDILKTYTHLVSGQIRIKKLVSDSTVLHLTRPINDNYDTVTTYSGLTFKIEKSYFENLYPPSYIPNPIDSFVKAIYSNHNLTIPTYGSEFPDCYLGWIVISNGGGKFVNGQWEINYQTKGKYRGILIENPAPGYYYESGYNTYHLICIKQN